MYNQFFNGLRHGFGSVFDINTRNLVPNSSPATSAPADSRSSFRNYMTPETFLSAAYTKIAIDIGNVDLRHVRLNDAGLYDDTIVSKLNDCLTLSANIDQTGRHLLRDIVNTMFNGSGVAIVVPTTYSGKMLDSESYEITSLRVGTPVSWYTDRVSVQLYNDLTGSLDEITVPKSKVAIIENPFYDIVNRPNSKVSQLVAKINRLEKLQDATTSGRIEAVIKTKYSLLREKRTEDAIRRQGELEAQLNNGANGIVWIGPDEDFVQLNRPAENQLVTDIDRLSKEVYGQIGISEGILHNTASEAEVKNYNARCLEPVLNAITEEMTRKFLSKTAITQKQRIIYLDDPFKLIPMSQLAEIADKFTRNEIASSNDIRSVIGMKPSKDPKADMLINSNLNQPGTDSAKQTEEENQNGSES